MVKIGCSELTLDSKTNVVTIVTHIPGAKTTGHMSLHELIIRLGITVTDVREAYGEDLQED